MNLILLGPPGSGKGTQAKHIVDELGLAHISTGDILRQAVAEGTPLGREAHQIMSAGQLVPDRIMIDLVRERLAKGVGGGFLLDGFPRTVEQAVGLEAMLHETEQKVDRVLSILVDGEALIQRMLGRAREEGRADDTEEVIAKRLEVYERQTLPVADWYRHRSLLIEIDGGGTIEEVWAEIRGQLERVGS
jgi:adenylate kinase